MEKIEGERRRGDEKRGRLPYDSLPPLPPNTILFLSPQRYASVESLLRAAYPEHPWDHGKFVAGKSGQQTVFTPQIFMSRIIRSVFPDAKVEMNSRAVHGIVGTSGSPLEIDVFLPEYKLGFEYQVRARMKS